ncbi:hypothetical protein C2U50_23460 [Klebsiella pneumoniae]|nr:hypothetical protein C2U49_26720 [Klebsiella pneumoniae]AUV39482.1 hypothetical protein C2U50_23460 [Klebsiella pneumoniae]AUY18689.1 hypothetical protein C3F39_07780 [Klebsiella pneumoniae]PNM32000.1 hypothetical protein AL478_003630 [Klebsiella pneumoniae]POW82941.1 hypothetical protein C3413_08000 [Klebsiella pneumoniae]
MQRHRAMPSGTEPLYCRVAAGALPGLQEPLTGSHLVGPVSAWTAPQKLDTQLSKVQFYG